MRRAILTRTESGDEGTFGTLFMPDTGFSCKTGELPWRDADSDGVSDRNSSCIPAGVYVCRFRKSPRHGMCYHVEGVPGREGIEIHPANFMGDRTKGLRCELRGCIALGQAVKYIKGQRGISSSRDAVAALEEELGGQDFELTIEDETELIVPAKKAA